MTTVIKTLLIGGDFNVCLDPVVDKKGGKDEKLSNFGSAVNDFAEHFNLIDVWRIINPDIKRFTWRGNTRMGLVQSRLDMWLVSAHMLYDLQDVDIAPGIKSDRSIIKIRFKTKGEKERGKGFWKFNSSLLKDADYIKRVNNVINESKIKYNDMYDKCLLWDVIKCEIRAVTISYGTWKAKQLRIKENTLHKRLYDLEQLIDNENSTLQQQYDETKSELESVIQFKAEGAFVRSRANYIELGEKCTKFFLQQEKNKSKSA